MRETIENIIDKSLIFSHNTLNEICDLKLPLVDVQYIEYKDYIEMFKENPINKIMFTQGIYKSDEDIKSFAVVFESDKAPLRQLMGLPFVIRVCLSICNRVLEPFTDEEKSIYLKFVLLHEMTHIFEKQIADKHNKVWQESLNRTQNNKDLASEEFANRIASLYCGDESIYESMEKEIYKEVMQRLSKR